MKKREHYMFCSDCGYAFKEEEIFQKTYANTAICLCRECALKLAREIMESRSTRTRLWSTNLLSRAETDTGAK